MLAYMLQKLILTSNIFSPQISIYVMLFSSLHILKENAQRIEVDFIIEHTDYRQQGY